MSYVPETPPVDVNQIPEYLERELRRIQDEFVKIHDMEILHSEPARLYDGMVRYADGTDWSPGGSGRGLYQYVSGAWVKL
jgi:hypothetical protein